jgi:hypothetical protein
MVAAPTVKPYTVPVVLTDATVELLVDQTPPVVALVSTVDEPTQTEVGPEMALTTGKGLTVTNCVSEAEPQILDTVYDISAVPPATPVTVPVVLTVAMVGLALDQVPPVVASESSKVLPAQTVLPPVIVPAPGAWVTVTSMVSDMEPQAALETVYDIIAVPDNTPVTVPVVLIVATPVLLDDQVPPVADSVKVTGVPIQIVLEPDIVPASGAEITFTSFVLAVDPQPLVTV